jgi:DNA gyrase subunit A
MPIEDRELIPVAVVDEMKDAYMDYAMSVIVSRALPDARDGLKPVHRRILYTMQEENITPDRAFKKSASTVGNVLARYHPHGDTAVYDAMVRMAQNFNLRYMLIQGHGNFGSVDGDSAAAMRYTEARLSKIAMYLLEDLDKDTVDWRPNFDASMQEPTVLPTRLPNLLLNGSDGIAVGMATKIPPHNLGELLDATLVLLENPETSIDDLILLVPGPDFPTGAQILGQAGIREAYRSGRGSILLRAKVEHEEFKHDRIALIVREIPYQVNKTRLLKQMAEAINEKRVEGVSGLRDESDRDGMRIVIELTSGAHPEVVTNQLFKFTELQTTYGINMLALVNGVPKTLNIREMLLVFLNHRREVVRRRSQFLLDKALKRAHIVEGLLKALDHIDAIIKLIRASQDANMARQGLISEFGFSEVQAQAILDMRLQRLTGLERAKLEEEYQELMATIEYLQSLLADSVKLDGVVRDELEEVRTLFGDMRRTEIVAHSFGELNIEDLIAEEQMVVTISHGGYIKRVPYDTYKTQRRGGRGISGTGLKEEDFLEHMYVTSTHHFLLFFTNKARVFKKKVHEIAEFSRGARGSAMVNLLNFGEGEKVAAVIPVRNFEDGGSIVTCSREGIIKRTDLEAYSRISQSGLIALNLRDGDELVGVKRTPGDQELLIVTRNGMAIRFNETDARSMGRTATGVRGVTLREDDQVVGMDSVAGGNNLLIVTNTGYGKRSAVEDYRLQTRGGFGVKTMVRNEKTGYIVAAMVVTEEHELMVSTVQGTLIRMNLRDISETGRTTQGVRLIRLDKGDQVGAVSIVIPEEEPELEIEEGEVAEVGELVDIGAIAPIEAAEAADEDLDDQQPEDE